MVSGREKAYEFLKNTVLADPATQGGFISEQEIAERVGISRTPVREALLRLAAEELVQLVPKRGAYIAPITGKDLHDLMEMRGLLERFAAEKTLADDTVPLLAMRAALEKQARLDSGETAQFIELDTQFHTLLVEAAGNPILAKTYQTLRARQVRAGMVAMLRSGDRQKTVLAEHQAILDAFESGDVAATLAAIDDHLGTTLAIQLTS
ncbi:GntR family transcriptional regulator [Amycolatopsis sp. CA-230715]|uniref:GntR family transcriptional regulator n=1 Tax=Amycolatopsis sp. CA-230715 TaxID=2745196 RepID=UPI001C033557|nr:GntR family transcriptional regulator [Amycolatopsis sp. CA-230715]QWF81383.1 HTH-type transcriptional repressor RspR [Amycolatopsis sp. CA-230715]